MKKLSKKTPIWYIIVYLVVHDKILNRHTDRHRQIKTDKDRQTDTEKQTGRHRQKDRHMACMPQIHTLGGKTGTLLGGGIANGIFMLLF